jgi:hypothetical protein
MSLREFRDAAGNEWVVWEVHPRLGDAYAEGRLRIPEMLTDGWLAFRSGQHRRRVTPIPAGWAASNDEALLELLESATVLPPARPDLRDSGRGAQQ